jgi:hypothetical protein
MANTLVTYPVRFNGILLSSIENFNVTATDPFRIPQRILNDNQLANSDLTAIPSAFYGKKKIHVKGLFTVNSKSQLETGLQNLMSLLTTRNSQLVFEKAGYDVEYTATMSNIMINEYAGGYAEVDIEFTCTDPFCYRTTVTTIENTSAHTTSSKTVPYTWSGNVEQLPVLKITINSVTLSGTSGDITLSNTTQGTSMTFSKVFVANDILKVDLRNKVFTINDSPVDFTGSILNFKSSEPIKYADTFTARNVKLLYTYQVRNI